MNIKTLRIATIVLSTLLAFVLPTTSALAEPPSDVKGLRAKVVRDEVFVDWTPLRTEDIVYYRIYYSSESILENDGFYDDFEVTDGPEGSFVFEDPPPVDTLYISVLAVNEDGEESVIFAEEISVVLKEEEVMEEVPLEEEVVEEELIPTLEEMPLIPTLEVPTLEEMPEPELIEEEVEEAPEEFCFSSDDCSSGEICSTELGDCRSVPSLTTVCGGVCFPKAGLLPAVEEEVPVEEDVIEEEVPVEEEEEIMVEEGEKMFVLPGQEEAPIIPEVPGARVGVAREERQLDETKLHLLSAGATSHNEVVLIFSGFPFIQPMAAPQAFHIIDRFGSALRIMSMTIEGVEITIQTEMQSRDTEYQVRVTEPLQGYPNLPLDTLNRTAFFEGHPTGLAATVAPAPTRTLPTGPVLPGQARDVIRLRLTAAAQADGKYLVTGNWQYDMSAGDLAYYIVRQSLDRGRTFGDPQMLPGNVAGVQLPGVMPGEFGLFVNTVNIYGNVSRGVFDTITLPGPGGVVPPPVALQPQVQPPMQPQAATVTAAQIAALLQPPPATRPTPPKDLAQTGAGIVIASITLVGGLLGWRRTRS